MSPEIARHAPLVAFAVGVVAFGAYLYWAVTRARLHQRPLPFAVAVLGLLPALYVAGAWARVFDDRYLRLERPLYALPAALVVVFVAHRLLYLPSRQGPLRRALTEMLIGLSALAAALAVSGPELGKPLDRLAVIVAIDRSRSIDLVPDADSRVRSELTAAETAMRDEDLIGVVAFAAEAAVEDPLRPRSHMPSPQKAELGRDGTDVAAAIRRALAEVPADSAARIVVVSDGVATRGDAIDAAAAAIAADVPIDAVPLDQAKVPDVRVVSVRAPPRATEGETFDLRVVTAADGPAELELRVNLDGEPLRKGRVVVSGGEDVIHLSEKAPGAGLHRYDVAITALDPRVDRALEDNTGSSFVRVRGPASALIMEGDRSGAVALEQALSAAAFRSHTVGASGVPADVAGFAAYDVVVLSDVQAADLSPTQIEAIASYVRDLGGGLVLMGGDRSLGPGGYGKTPIEEVSPVSFDLKQERRKASLAEVIVIDYSGSMAMHAGGHTKLELANEAAVRSAQLLGSGDRLGVMHVDTVVKWTVPLGPMKDKAALERDIRAVGVGGGGILVDLSLDAAYPVLAAEKVNLKHVLLFADGADAEEMVRAPSLVGDARRRGITTSVIALGRGSDVAGLEHLSKLGDGRFYLIEDATRLPAVFAQETVMAARSSINEVDFKVAQSSPGQATRGIDFGDAPALAGYVVTIPKGRAQVHLRGPEGDPILATWSVGIGRAAAFTSDYKDRWGSAWTRWPSAARLFAQLARDVARRADDPHVRLEADAAGGELHVRATVVDDDGRTESFRRLKLFVGGPDGFQHETPLEAIGAGAYATVVPLSRPGAYIATAIDELSNEPSGTTGAVLSAGEELRPTGTNRALLGRVTEMTGGKLRDTLAGIFRDRVSKRFSYTSLTTPLLLAAALALLFGVAARRLALPDALARLPRRIAARLRRRPSPEAERPDATDTVGALLGRKARGEATPPGADPAPPSVPRFATRPPPMAAAPLGAPPPSGRAGPASRRSGPSAPPPPGPPAGGAPPGMSTAEILLARRRGRR